MKDMAKLAMNGGPKARTAAWPERGLIGAEEKLAVDALFDAAIRTGQAPGYNGAEEEAYCREFAASLGGGFADGVNSGTTAVYVALKALESSHSRRSSWGRSPTRAASCRSPC